MPKLSDYTYTLPKDHIAQHPPRVRGQAKLLVLNKNNGHITDKKYPDIITYLKPGDVLILNDTKVIKARLIGLGTDGKEHELVLIEQHGKVDDKFYHKAIYRGKLVANMALRVGEHDVEVVGVYEDGTALLHSKVDFMELCQKYGHVPLPPYMKRADTKEDAKRYQTEFSRNIGSVAAPTASLNMTKELVANIKAKGVSVCYVTLHVGLGTFLPIRTNDLSEHTMHSEWVNVPKTTAAVVRQAKQTGGRVVAVGTTVARTLEYCADAITGNIPEKLSGEADIFIYPGYEFQIIDALATNFHAPKSTVLMLTAAFAGKKNLFDAYQHALKSNYRFLSYGDSMLIID